MTDTAGATGTVAIPITVIPVNDAPTASAPTLSLDEDTAAAVQVTVGDPDVGDVHTFAITTPPTHGQATVDASGLVGYSPEANYNGSDTLNITVTDSAGATGTVSIPITVIPVNDPPVVSAPTLSLNEDTTAAVQVTVSDPDVGDVHTFAITTPPTHGQAAVDASGLVSYSPEANYNGSDTLNITVTDSAGATGTVSIAVTVIPVNDPPVAQASGPSQAFVGDAVALDGAASFDIDGDVLTYRWQLTAPDGSSASLNNAATAQPSFAVAAKGVYVVTLVVNDGAVDSPPVTVAIQIPNRAPTARGLITQNAFAGDTIYLDGSGSRDPDGDRLTYRWQLTARPDPSGAALSDSTAAAPDFTADLPGDYEATLTVSDGQAQASTTVHVTVLPSLSAKLENGPLARLLVWLPQDSGPESNHEGEHHHGDAPAVSPHRALLEGLLASWGWSATVVSDATAFLQGLEGGGYAAYALLGDVAPDGTTLKLLSAAVERGEGLLVAGGDGDGLEAVLGIQTQGANRAFGVSLDAGSLSDGGSVALADSLPGILTQPITALVVGHFLHMNAGNGNEGKGKGKKHDHGEEHTPPSDAAVTVNRFGDGSAVWVAFDLLGQVAQQGDVTLLGDLLGKALTLIGPAPVLNHAALGDAVVPVQATVGNVGHVTTTARVTLTLPPGVQVVDYGGMGVQPDGSVVGYAPLDAGQNQTFRLWLRLPGADLPGADLPAGPAALDFTAAIAMGAWPNLQPAGIADPTLTLDLLPRPGLSQAALVAREMGDKRLSKLLAQADAALREGKPGKALELLLQARDRQEDEGSPELRIAIDHAIRQATESLLFNKRDHGEHEGEESGHE
ncbi:MAG: hypothetical protein COX57_03795 [Alphaproteobacteria bacterium CG_4_10_14_0_2_um_filter_63_37]|nr:MAG: hypothetical protein COX57_03795 [Alphaproteobacteria bacterium CG_4_10_14_0_2_um_filter_63_37]